MSSSLLRRWCGFGVIVVIGLGSSARAQNSDQLPEVSSGLQAFEDCVLVPTDWADGDSFRIAVEGALSMTVRLYGADCLEWHVNNPTAARRLRAQRRYFGISETGEDVRTSIEAAKDLGRRAALRVRELLTEPFTVYTAGTDARGSGGYERVYAFVMTSQGRDLAAQLVVEGLARAYGVFRMGPDGAHRDEVRARMADQELAAAKMGRGIWALTDWEKLPEERRIDREEEAELATAMDASRHDLDSLRIDPNTASVDELMRLPGIGEVIAGSIIEGRNAGRYETPEDLTRVHGIGEKTLARIRVYLSIAP